GTAHTLRIADLATSDRVEFRLGHSWSVVSSATRLLGPPGTPFSAPGGTLAGDFLLYALDSAPSGVRILELAEPGALDALAPGAAVQIVGIPAQGGTDEAILDGRIREISDERIEVELDRASDLRGWGGAPVIAPDSGRVIGMVQASAPSAATPRITVGPIAQLRGALAKAGSGESSQGFAQLAAIAAAQQRTQGGPQPRLIAPPVQTQLELEIEFPGDGAVVSDSPCGAFVAGRATGVSAGSKRFDVALVLDTSGSAAEPTGADVNGNGVIGTSQRGRIASLFGGSTDKGDSVLAAEVAAARQILHDLDPRTTRVAVITFAGSDDKGVDAPPALTRQPLTSDFALAERALEFILRTEPQGQTHISGAVDHTTKELLGLFGSRSEKLDDSEKLMFFFTDGIPTLPYGQLALSDNLRAVRASALRASKGRVRIHSFAIGAEALEGPIASVELADLTGGSFIPVRHPGELAAVVDALSFANLEQVTLRNQTTGALADPFRVTADGSWGGFVKLAPGSNSIEIAARSSDGHEANRALHVVHEPAAAALAVPAELSLRHNRLLEDCLRNLKQLRVETEREQAEQVRRELLLEIERERAKARERAAEQRKQIELEVETED
ncbi:MAG TPA: hypothetical protein VEC18_01765, partial [Myxococcota bacterium]|nr:hypothetical protein [Myxococcota bacterium]